MGGGNNMSHKKEKGSVTSRKIHSSGNKSETGSEGQVGGGDGQKERQKKTLDTFIKEGKPEGGQEISGWTGGRAAEE